MRKTIFKMLRLFILSGLLAACGGGNSNGDGPGSGNNNPPAGPTDHSTAEGLACASSSCHDGFSAPTYKTTTHPVTSELCEACHTMELWKPVILPFDHANTTDSCENCHNSIIASGKNATHLPTIEPCSNCHVVDGWLISPP